MNDLDILCKCGHPKSIHCNSEKAIKSDGHKICSCGNNVCCFEMEGSPTFSCINNCQGYVPDNLLTIEQLAKERNLV
jgi:hypothetical protein